MRGMNPYMIEKIHEHNTNAAWKQAFNMLIGKFIDQGYDLATASTMADDRLFEVNWLLSTAPE